jgi:hypothetical protein
MADGRIGGMLQVLARGELQSTDAFSVQSNFRSRYNDIENLGCITLHACPWSAMGHYQTWISSQST